MPPEEVPPLRDESFYIEQRIERIKSEVTSLDAANRALRLADGQSLNYDAAVIATGGTPNPLKLPGADLPQVFVLRSKDQAQQILTSAKPGQRAVIIGDSFIALESASCPASNTAWTSPSWPAMPSPSPTQFGDSCRQGHSCPAMWPTAWYSTPMAKPRRLKAQTRSKR